MSKKVETPPQVPTLPWKLAFIANDFYVHTSVENVLLWPGSYEEDEQEFALVTDVNSKYPLLKLTKYGLETVGKTESVMVYQLPGHKEKVPPFQSLLGMIGKRVLPRPVGPNFGGTTHTIPPIIRWVEHVKPSYSYSFKVKSQVNGKSEWCLVDFCSEAKVSTVLEWDSPIEHSTRDAMEAVFDQLGCDFFKKAAYECHLGKADQAFDSVYAKPDKHHPVQETPVLLDFACAFYQAPVFDPDTGSHMPAELDGPFSYEIVAVNPFPQMYKWELITACGKVISVDTGSGSVHQIKPHIFGEPYKKGIVVGEYKQLQTVFKAHYEAQMAGTKVNIKPIKTTGQGWAYEYGKIKTNWGDGKYTSNPAFDEGVYSQAKKKLDEWSTNFGVYPAKQLYTQWDSPITASHFVSSDEVFKGGEWKDIKFTASTGDFYKKPQDAPPKKDKKAKDVTNEEIQFFGMADKEGASIPFIREWGRLRAKHGKGDYLNVPSYHLAKKEDLVGPKAASFAMPCVLRAFVPDQKVFAPKQEALCKKQEDIDKFADTLGEDEVVMVTKALPHGRIYLLGDQEVITLKGSVGLPKQFIFSNPWEVAPHALRIVRVDEVGIFLEAIVDLPSTLSEPPWDQEAFRDGYLKSYKSELNHASWQGIETTRTCPFFLGSVAGQCAKTVLAKYTVPAAGSDMKPRIVSKMEERAASLHERILAGADFERGEVAAFIEDTGLGNYFDLDDILWVVRYRLDEVASKTKKVTPADLDPVDLELYKNVKIVLTVKEAQARVFADSHFRVQLDCVEGVYEFPNGKTSPVEHLPKCIEKDLRSDLPDKQITELNKIPHSKKSKAGTSQKYFPVELNASFDLVEPTTGYTVIPSATLLKSLGI